MRGRVFEHRGCRFWIIRTGRFEYRCETIRWSRQYARLLHADGGLPAPDEVVDSGYEYGWSSWTERRLIRKMRRVVDREFNRLTRAVEYESRERS